MKLVEPYKLKRSRKVKKIPKTRYRSQSARNYSRSSKTERSGENFSGIQTSFSCINGKRVSNVDEVD